jgi:hypothetical protein
MDLEGNIIYIEPVLTGDDGAFSTDFVVPDVNTGTLTITAGSGSNVASAEFTVKQTVFGGGSSSDDDEDTEEDITIGDEEGNTAGGKRTDNEDGSEVEISREDFDELAENGDGTVTIDVGIAEVTFNGKAMDHISGNADDGDISLTVEEVDPSTLSAKAQARIGACPVYDFTLMAGDTQISNFDGKAAISVPYTLKNGENPHAVVIYYISDSGELKTVRGKYNAETGTVDFTATHFSVYAVGYNEVTFDDVSENAWYYDAVTFCAAREITTGTGNDLFSPDSTLTRGQFIVMLMRAYNIDPDEAINDNFDDAGDTYYTGYLSAAKRTGISNGVGNNLYAPESRISRQNMFTLLYRALAVLEELPEASGSTSLSNFGDADNISDYAKDAMETLVAAGIVSGSSGKLDPLGSSTRAQMAQVLYNLLSI